MAGRVAGLIVAAQEHRKCSRLVIERQANRSYKALHDPQGLAYIPRLLYVTINIAHEHRIAHLPTGY